MSASRLKGFLGSIPLAIAVLVLQVLFLWTHWSKARLVVLCREQATTILRLQSALSNPPVTLTIEVSTNGVDWLTNALHYEVPGDSRPAPEMIPPMEGWPSRDGGRRIRRL